MCVAILFLPTRCSKVKLVSKTINVVRYYKEITGYTIPQVADSMELAVSTVQRLANDGAPITKENTAKILDLLLEYVKEEKSKSKIIIKFVKEFR